MRAAGRIAALVLTVWAGGVAAQEGPASGGTTAPAMPSQTIPAPADSSPVAAIPLLTVDQEALFSRSAWGRRTQRVLEETGREVAAENERLATQLAAEESELTDQRPTLDPAEFRRLAEAFDARATAIRRERAQVVEDLNGWAEADRAAFYRAALPLMGEMMQERGAVAVLDRRTVFVSLDAIDMTDDLVARLDADLGDGQGTVPLTVPQDQQN
ncbi:OmpH family outer membrane protein [Paracoccus subflavus]|uniref:OmpH family outer membrane protein n=2 Tax=Paracoccus subflavus TaxID=2528244 RepID=A0A4Q9G5G3_9RHOB|nr:OmpH family outer membrane protein [Paracoccus subflavus]